MDSLDEAALAQVIDEYGEERHARRIARRIREALESGERAELSGEQGTAALARIVEQAIPAAERAKAQARGAIHPATRTFQALRIAVNAELESLDQLLESLPDLLGEGGRVAIIAFHSLEDRQVKQALRRLSAPEKDPVTGQTVRPGVLRELWRKPRTPGEAELAANPRARSARLRAAQKMASS
jgi:16S rRNA (cytosine1402-N4)-methyltransferase